MKRIGFAILVSVLCITVVGVPSAAAEFITPGRVLYVDFDIVSGCSGQPECGPPNLIFLQFRGGVTFSPGAAATATLLIDGVPLGSTGVDETLWQGFPAYYWEFAGPGFQPNYIFQNPTTVDFTPVAVGSHGLIMLRMNSGQMNFGFSPYELNAPLVVFNNISLCGGYNCVQFNPSTLDLANLEWEVRPIPEPASLLLLGTGLIGLARSRRHWG